MSTSTYIKTRAIFNLTNVSPEWYTENVILCVPRFAWEMTRALLTGYAFRRSSYATEYFANSYETPDDVEFDQIDESISRFLGASDMCEEIAEGLAAIVGAINNLELATAAAGQDCDGGCGRGGSRGAGGSAASPDDGGGGDDGWFPPGFDNRAEYLLAKCAAANALLSSIIIDMGYLQGLQIGQAAVALFAATLLTPIPFDDLIAIVTIVVAMLAAATLTANAQEIIDYIGDNAEQLVCGLYTAENAEDARAVLDTALQGGVSGGAYYLIGFWLNYDGINALFEKDTIMQESGQTMNIDCDDCECPGEFVEFFDSETEPQTQECLENSGVFNVAPLVSTDVLGCGARFAQYIEFSSPATISAISESWADGCVMVWRSAPDGVTGDPFDVLEGDIANVVFPLTVKRLSLISAVDLASINLTFSF